MPSNNKSALVQLSAEHLVEVTGGIDELASDDLGLLDATQTDPGGLKSLRTACALPATNWNYWWWRP